MKKTTLKNSIVMIVFFAVMFACGSEKTIQNSDLHLALRLSGENRSELEKVLNHYSVDKKDSLKLKAAEFLIRNMIHHRSMSGKYVDGHVKMIDSLFHDAPIEVRAVHYIIPLYVDSLKQRVETELDIEKISADFLIKNIEYSFSIWEGSIYEPKIGFDDFCEYILPYKFGNEPLILWKDSIAPSYDICRDFNTYELNMEAMNTYIRSRNYEFFRLINTRLKGTKLEKYREDVEVSSYKDLTTNRAYGIPSAIDFIPYLSTRNYTKSYWSAVINHKYIDDIFTYTSIPFSSKIFRKTYSLNPTPNDDENFVPDFIKDPYNKDVTNIYQNVTTVEYDFQEVPSNVKYAYLAVFHDGKWCEVAWAELKDGKARFENMGRDVIYMPLYYNGDNRVNAETPILVNRKGITEKIGVDDNKKQSMTIKRLSSYTISAEYDMRYLVGSKIGAFNDIKSIKLDSIVPITHCEYMNYDTVNTNCNKKYKNWCLVVQNFINISELEFFNSKEERIHGKYFNINIKNEPEYIGNFIDKISDRDVMTYGGINSCFGISCEQPTEVSYVRFAPRIDGSSVMKGNTYELYYFKEGEWFLHEKKIAQESKLEFQNVPVGALFWLHDKSKECDERPFTIINGKIKFW